MLTTRLSISDDDDDPYSCVPRCKSSDEDLSVSWCHGERVLHEVWCMKQSKWLRQWRRRWFVLTATRILTFRSARGYARAGERATEQFMLHSMPLGSVRILDDAELKEKGIQASAIEASFFPTAHSMHSILLVAAARRDLLLDFSPAAHLPEGASGRDARAIYDLTCQCATAVVNARCALKCQLPMYNLTGCAHAFEPRGATAFRERVALADELGVRNSASNPLSELSDLCSPRLGCRTPSTPADATRCSCCYRAARRFGSGLSRPLPAVRPRRRSEASAGAKQQPS